MLLIDQLDAPNPFQLSRIDLHFSNIDKRHCWELNSFLNQRWYFDKNDSKYSEICLNMNFSYTLEIFDKMLTVL